MIIRIQLCLLVITIFSLLNISCESHDNHKIAALQDAGDTKLFTFKSDEKQFLISAQPFVINAGTSLKSALNRLGAHLAETYFSRTYSNEKTNIRFEVRGIHEVPADPRGVRIAVINMIDKEKFAMNYFFQGSAGAQTTFYMLVATFTQPQLAVSLVDGLIILYNGKLLSEMDHINLSGIQTPSSVRNLAVRAIQNTRTEEANLLYMNKIHCKTILG